VTRVLFVTNGHGEAAIAQRIALEVQGLEPAVHVDHLALVGNAAGGFMNEIGPRRAMPSGGLIAMGNVRNLARDLRAGLLQLTWRQVHFLRGARGRYDAAVCVGDVYALAMTLLVRAPTVFVGSAKSVSVAPYGAFEARVLARADWRFVRDQETAGALSRRGLQAEAANAIVDLLAAPREASAAAAVSGFEPALALLPGSRERAYDDAAYLLTVTHALAEQRPRLGAALSIAAGLSADRFAHDGRATGWRVRATGDELVPFVFERDGREIVRAWRGPLGPLLERVVLVLGQAGTANEAAAAAGVPVIAFQREGERKARWYRRRQQGLLGGALAVVSAEGGDAVEQVAAILDDPSRRKRMGEIGRARMGEPGGARRIARRVAEVIRKPQCDG
jgi:uncharacterized protein (TIGR03492 family)